MISSRRFTMKKLVPFAGVALACFLALSAGNVLVFRGLKERYRLESRNDSEGAFSTLFASLRDQDDFGSAIESTQSLKSKILGFGLYDAKGAVLYHWGAVPESYPPPAFNGAEINGDMARLYLENPANDSVVVLLSPLRDAPPPPPDSGKGYGRSGRARGFSPIFEILRRTGTIYLETSQPRYWRQARLLSALFPTVEAALAALVSFISFTVMKNREYRRRIEEQKNLVILGTAASTLAHEIKNPLLAIRLQTSIIAKGLPGKARRELEIIDSEVERLSALGTRVNDFLRDPRGQPERIDAAEVASDVCVRLCGRPFTPGMNGREAAVSMDAERLRSVLENLLRNALESGGKPEDVGVEIAEDGGRILIAVLDRGRGISAQDRERIFDPFFTTKSRGTGIGLAICRRFVQAAGGTVLLEDRPGGGTVARIALPEAGARQETGGEEK
jgi:two-component system sensor histidine kinase HydH